MSSATRLQLLLDLAAHRLRPGLGAEDADAQLQGGRVDAQLPHRLGHVQRVRRRAGEHGRAEVLEDHDLALGVAARDRDDRRAEPLGAVVHAEPAGEQAVAVGVVDDVAAPDAGARQRAGADLGPGVDVAQRVADDGHLAGRARGGVDAHDVGQRHGEEAERVVVAQVLLRREGQPAQVLEACGCRRRRFPRRAASPGRTARLR